MANPKEITVGFTYTKNIGNYENVKADAQMTVSLDPDDDVNEVYNKSYDYVKEQIKNGLNKFGEEIS